MGHQLRALGHKAVWDVEWSKKNYIGKDLGWNVIVEGFTPGVVEMIARGYNNGARFICLATEEPTDKGFNHGTQPEMVMRQEVFPTIAPYLDGIIHLVPGERITKWYGQFAPTAYSELGYAPSLVRPDKVVPDYDFGFYGSMTKRRLKILKKLATATRKEKAVKLMTDFGTQHERDITMQRAKVIVQLRKFDEMGLVSSSRCNTALCLGRPVVAEPHELSEPWDKIVRFSSTTEGFINYAMFTLSQWKNIHRDQMDKFKARLSPDQCFGQALRQIGLEDPTMRKTA